uniref:folate gamma-glutamyl hydrolase n=1 Tax=Romanomermis culicivorax TaxID=13658 RepID=A0A915IU75_ROMCU
MHAVKGANSCSPVLSFVTVAVMASTPDRPTTNNSPIIGILAVMADNRKNGKYCLPASYVKNVESSGARVVPIFPERGLDYYKMMFKRLNGLLIPGGSGNPLEYQKPVTDTVRLFLRWSMEAYDNSENPEYWPVWGTCLGFEILAVLSAGRNCLSDCNCIPGSYPATPAKDFDDSRLVRSLPEDLRQAITEDFISPHLHAYCLTVRDFFEHGIEKQYKLLATKTDSQNLEYAVIIEARKYPIYGLMSHQEKAVYQWDERRNFDHSPKAVRLAQAFMNFFVDECRKNGRCFENEDVDPKKYLIQNFRPKSIPHSKFYDEIYYFD